MKKKLPRYSLNPYIIEINEDISIDLPKVALRYSETQIADCLERVKNYVSVSRSADNQKAYLISARQQICSTEKIDVHIKDLIQKYLMYCINALEAKEIADQHHIQDDINAENSLSQLFKWFFSNFDTQNFVEGDEDKVSFMDDVEKKDYVGLINFGNSCYINSVLQMLFKHPHFSRLTQEMTAKDPDLLHAFIKLRDIRNAKNQEAFYLKCIEKNLVIRNIQNDPHEFFINLCDKLEIQQIQSPITYIETRLQKNEETNTFKVTSKHEIPTNNLELCIEKHNVSSVQESINNFFILEEKTEPTTHVTHSQVSLNAVPKYLNVNLNRFTSSFENNMFHNLKNTKEINCDLNVTLKVDGSDYHYQLKSVIVHLSYDESGNNGHYVNYILENDTWYCINDSSISAVSEKTVVDKAKRNGYLYFFQLHGEPEVESLTEATEVKNIGDISDLTNTLFSDDESDEENNNEIDSDEMNQDGTSQVENNVVGMDEDGTSQAENNVVGMDQDGTSQTENNVFGMDEDEISQVEKNVVGIDQNGMNEDGINPDVSGDDEFSEIAINSSISEASQSSSLSSLEMQSVGNTYHVDQSLSFEFTGKKNPNSNSINDNAPTELTLSHLNELFAENGFDIEFFKDELGKMVDDNILYSHQADAVIQAICANLEGNTFFLGDGCGVGKSRTIYAIAQLSNKLLERKDGSEHSNIKSLILVKNKDSISDMTNLTKIGFESNNIDIKTKAELKTINISDYSTIIIDEAHEIQDKELTVLSKYKDSGKNFTFASATIASSLNGFKKFSLFINKTSYIHTILKQCKKLESFEAVLFQTIFNILKTNRQICSKFIPEQLLIKDVVFNKPYEQLDSIKKKELDNYDNLRELLNRVNNDFKTNIASLDNNKMNTEIFGILDRFEDSMCLRYQLREMIPIITINPHYYVVFSLNHYNKIGRVNSLKTIVLNEFCAKNKLNLDLKKYNDVCKFISSHKENSLKKDCFNNYLKPNEILEIDCTESIDIEILKRILNTLQEIDKLISEHVISFDDNKKIYQKNIDGTQLNISFNPEKLVEENQIYVITEKSATRKNLNQLLLKQSDVNKDPKFELHTIMIRNMKNQQVESQIDNRTRRIDNAVTPNSRRRTSAFGLEHRDLKKGSDAQNLLALQTGKIDQSYLVEVLSLAEKFKAIKQNKDNISTNIGVNIDNYLENLHTLLKFVQREFTVQQRIKLQLFIDNLENRQINSNAVDLDESEIVFMQQNIKLYFYQKDTKYVVFGKFDSLLPFSGLLEYLTESKLTIFYDKHSTVFCGFYLTEEQTKAISIELLSHVYEFSKTSNQSQMTSLLKFLFESKKSNQKIQRDAGARKRSVVKQTSKHQRTKQQRVSLKQIVKVLQLNKETEEETASSDDDSSESDVSIPKSKKQKKEQSSDWRWDTIDDSGKIPYQQFFSSKDDSTFLDSLNTHLQSKGYNFLYKLFPEVVIDSKKTESQESISFYQYCIEHDKLNVVEQWETGKGHRDSILGILSSHETGDNRGWNALHTAVNTLNFNAVSYVVENAPKLMTLRCQSINKQRMRLTPLELAFYNLSKANETQQQSSYKIIDFLIDEQIKKRTVVLNKEKISIELCSSAIKKVLEEKYSKYFENSNNLSPSSNISMSDDEESDVVLMLSTKLLDRPKTLSRSAWLIEAFKKKTELVKTNYNFLNNIIQKNASEISENELNLLFKQYTTLGISDVDWKKKIQHLFKLLCEEKPEWVFMNLGNSTFTTTLLTSIITDDLRMKLIQYCLSENSYFSQVNNLVQKTQHNVLDTLVSLTPKAFVNKILEQKQTDIKFFQVLVFIKFGCNMSGYIVEDETINTLIANNKLQEIKDVKSYTFMEIEKDRFLINKCVTLTKKTFNINALDSMGFENLGFYIELLNGTTNEKAIQLIELKIMNSLSKVSESFERYLQNEDVLYELEKQKEFIQKGLSIIFPSYFTLKSIVSKTEIGINTKKLADIFNVLSSYESSNALKITYNDLENIIATLNASQNRFVNLLREIYCSGNIKRFQWPKVAHPITMKLLLMVDSQKEFKFHAKIRILVQFLKIYNNENSIQLSMTLFTQMLDSRMISYSSDDKERYLVDTKDLLEASTIRNIFK